MYSFTAIVILLYSGCAFDGANVIGPAGGFIFYDKGGYSDGWRYLEAAPEDAGEVELLSEAQPICEQYSRSGYNDWYLPSKNEFEQMFNSFKSSFTEYEYYMTSSGSCEIGYSDISWSSSEYHRSPYKVRPIRRF
jgi:hypothetical protein